MPGSDASASLGSLHAAVARSMAGRYLQHAVSLGTTMVLARLFAPHLFGVIGAVNVFLVGFRIITEAGLSPALIAAREVTPRTRDGLFSLSLTLGALAASGFYLLAGPLESFYSMPRVGEVVPYLALSLLLSAASIVPLAALQRDQAFYRMAQAGSLGELASLFLVVALVLRSSVDPLHALALRWPGSALVTFLVAYRYAADTDIGCPRPGASLSPVKPLLTFSLFQFGFNAINFFSRNLDNILVGRTMGALPLALYERSYMLMTYPLQLLTFAMTPAILPTLREHVDRPDVLEGIHRAFVTRLAVLGTLVGLGLAVTSEWTVLILLGRQWVDVVPVIRVLALAVPVQTVLSTSGSFFQVMGRTDLLFLSGSLSAAVTCGAIVAGVLRADLVALSWLLVVAFHVNFVQTYVLLHRYAFRAPLLPFLRAMVRPFAAVAVAIGLGRLGLLPSLPASWLSSFW